MSKEQEEREQKILEQLAIEEGARKEDQKTREENIRIKALELDVNGLIELVGASSGERIDNDKVSLTFSRAQEAYIRDIFRIPPSTPLQEKNGSLIVELDLKQQAFFSDFLERNSAFIGDLLYPLDKQLTMLLLSSDEKSKSLKNLIQKVNNLLEQQNPYNLTSQDNKMFFEIACSLNHVHHLLKDDCRENKEFIERNAGRLGTANDAAKKGATWKEFISALVSAAGELITTLRSAPAETLSSMTGGLYFRNKNKNPGEIQPIEKLVKNMPKKR